MCQTKDVADPGLGEARRHPGPRHRRAGRVLARRDPRPRRPAHRQGARATSPTTTPTASRSRSWRRSTPCAFSLERIRRGEDTISVTGNVLRDYLTDLFPILELGTSAKMLSIVPLMNGGGLFETGAGGSAPKHVQQLVKENYLRWDSPRRVPRAGRVASSTSPTTTGNKRAQVLADTLDLATGTLLEENKSPGRKVGPDRQPRQPLLPGALLGRGAGRAGRPTPSWPPRSRRSPSGWPPTRTTIAAELLGVQGQPADLGGYYAPDPAKATAVMRPSPTFNAALATLVQAERGARTRVVAFNTATASTNKIHDDEVAAALGFRGGLVPGVDVYAYLCHPPAARVGPSTGCERGTMRARFHLPVYDGHAAHVSSPDGERLELHDEDGRAVRRRAPRRSAEPAPRARSSTTGPTSTQIDRPAARVARGARARHRLRPRAARLPRRPARRVPRRRARGAAALPRARASPTRAGSSATPTTCCRPTSASARGSTSSRSCSTTTSSRTARRSAAAAIVTEEWEHKGHRFVRLDVLHTRRRPPGRQDRPHRHLPPRGPDVCDATSDAELAAQTCVSPGRGWRGSALTDSLRLRA